MVEFVTIDTFSKETKRMDNKAFTTGQVAKFCQVSPSTVAKWFDQGRLKGYRVPGSQDRTIPLGELMSFLREYGLPI